MRKKEVKDYQLLKELCVPYGFKSSLIGQILDQAGCREQHSVKPSKWALENRIAIHQGAFYLWHKDTVGRLVDHVIRRALEGKTLNRDKQRNGNQKAKIQRYLEGRDLEPLLQAFLAEKPIIKVFRSSCNEASENNIQEAIWWKNSKVVSTKTRENVDVLQKKVIISTT